MMDSVSGSPPHGRGKGHGCHQTAVVVGITPAWAGKRTTRNSGRKSTRDHPRMGGEKLSCISLLGELLESPPQCGEKMGRFSCTNSVPGSPPRGRGKGDGRHRHYCCTGITPALAGKSGRTSARTRPGRDHPRMGGEKSCLAASFSHRFGSPPRGRGKAGKTTIYQRLEGITPAWAGKSSRRLAIGT